MSRIWRAPCEKYSLGVGVIVSGSRLSTGRQRTLVSDPLRHRTVVDGDILVSCEQAGERIDSG